MPLLDGAVLQDSYDVIVVGSGLAGLTAAALIAKRGLGVLLVEHHYLPGGMCTTLRRQGFSFDTGTALMYGFGERGVNPHRFVMNELGADLDVIEHDALLRMRLPPAHGHPGLEIVFWPDYERFVDELASAFPAQAGQVRALYAYLYRVYHDIIAKQQLIVPPSEIPAGENLRKLLRHPLAMLQTLRMLDQPTSTILDRYISDPYLRAFFDKLCSTYVYCTADETPAILAATMFIDNHVGGAYYPARSPQILASTLERALEEAGGQCLYGYRVDEILIENGAAVGVRLAAEPATGSAAGPVADPVADPVGGVTIGARQVVANATVWNLYGKLVRPEHISPERLAWAQSFVPTFPSLVVYLGVDAEAIPPGTLPVEMLVADAEGVNGGDLTLYISSLDDPSICPPGTHAITAIAPSTERWPSPWDPEYNTHAYQAQKLHAVTRVLDQIEEHFPEIRRHVRVLEAGTPATIERYTLKNGGAAGGPKQSIGQQLLRRLHARTEWKNLYACGDSTVMGMGSPAVTVSGIGAANVLLEDAGLPGYTRRQFAREAVHIVRGRPLAPLPAPGAPIDRASAMRLARECEYCQNPGCTAACPASIDMRNVMRRIEAGNFAGAARLLHESNPLAEVCGHVCGPRPPCEAVCNRLNFADNPVRIADLQAWVCHEAGAAGWPAAGHRAPIWPVAGKGPAGWPIGTRKTAALRATAERRSAAHPPSARQETPRDELPGQALLPQDPTPAPQPPAPAAAPQSAAPYTQDPSTGLPPQPVTPDPVAAGLPAEPDQGQSAGAASHAAGRVLPDLALFPEIAVVGAGPAGLSCAYYLARAGCRVTLLERTLEPGGALLTYPAGSPALEAAHRDIAGVLAQQIEFVANFSLGEDEARDGEAIATGATVAELAQDYDAVYLATGAGSRAIFHGLELEPLSGEVWRVRGAGADTVFAGGDLLRGPCSVVQAVADGLRAAQAILA